MAGRLAVLFEAARDFGAATRNYLTAAQRAVGLYAFREALSLSERGLSALHGLPDGPQRIQHELGLLMIRGLALRLMKGWSAPEIEPVFARARELCHQLNDPPELFPVLWALTLFHAIRGDLREYRRRADELMAMAQASGKPAFLMGAHHLVGVSREFLGNMVEASAGARPGARAPRPFRAPRLHRDVRSGPGDDCPRDVEPAVVGAGVSRSRARPRAGDPRARAFAATANDARIRAARHAGAAPEPGEIAEALLLGDETVALCRDYELIQEREWSRSFQGAALAAAGRLEEGIEQLKDSLAVQQAIGSGLVRSAFLGVLGDLLRFAGHIDEGLAAVDEGLAHAERTLEGGYIAELHRARGELLRSAGDTARAEGEFRKAIAYACDQQAKSFELRAAIALANLLASTGRRPDAQAVLRPVYDWFSEGHGTADLAAARAALDALR